MLDTNKLATLLGIFVVTPIWYYLVWWMLNASHAGELQMFLFWVYVPLGLAVKVLLPMLSNPTS